MYCLAGREAGGGACVRAGGRDADPVGAAVARGGADVDGLSAGFAVVGCALRTGGAGGGGALVAGLGAVLAAGGGAGIRAFATASCIVFDFCGMGGRDAGGTGTDFIRAVTGGGSFEGFWRLRRENHGYSGIGVSHTVL